jgi:threonine/homoserine efflux transporter RhtA
MVLKHIFKPDRRRRKRQWLNTSVQVFAGSTRVDGLGINLSDVGMCLFTIANLPLGSQIQLEFLQPRCAELVRVSGTVRHRAVYLYGIEFLMDSDQAALDCADAATTTRQVFPVS